MVSLQIQIHSQILRTDVPLQVLLPQPVFGGEEAEKAEKREGGKRGKSETVGDGRTRKATSSDRRREVATSG